MFRQPPVSAYVTPGMRRAPCMASCAPSSYWVDGISTRVINGRTNSHRLNNLSSAVNSKLGSQDSYSGSQISGPGSFDFLKLPRYLFRCSRLQKGKLLDFSQYHHPWKPSNQQPENMRAGAWTHRSQREAEPPLTLDEPVCSYGLEKLSRETRSS